MYVVSLQTFYTLNEFQQWGDNVVEAHLCVAFIQCERIVSIMNIFDQLQLSKDCKDEGSWLIICSTYVEYVLLLMLLIWSECCHSFLSTLRSGEVLWVTLKLREMPPNHSNHLYVHVFVLGSLELKMHYSNCLSIVNAFKIETLKRKSRVSWERCWLCCLKALLVSSCFLVSFWLWAVMLCRSTGLWVTVCD